MSNTREYIIIFREFPIEPQGVKNGANSPQVVTACRSVNVGLFVSGNLRRDVIIDIAIRNSNDLLIIQFPGTSLRRVSPDERSISFFMLKSMRELWRMERDEKRTMSNGIILEHVSLDDKFEIWITQGLKIADKDAPPLVKDNIKTIEGFFLYDVNNTIQEIIPSKYTKIYRNRTPERFFHEINLVADKLMSLRKPS